MATSVLGEPSSMRLYTVLESTMEGSMAPNKYGPGSVAGMEMLQVYPYTKQAIGFDAW
jgi:hypothetical protein